MMHHGFVIYGHKLGIFFRKIYFFDDLFGKGIAVFVDNDRYDVLLVKMMSREAMGTTEAFSL